MELHGQMMRTLFAYHWHTTRRILTAAAAVEPEKIRRSAGYGHGSIHSILFHLLRTDRNWRVAMETGHQAPPLVAEDFPDLESLEQGFSQEEAAWDALLGQLSEVQIGEAMELTSWRGETITLLRWQILQHVVLHGMQHHSELGRLLADHGQVLGDIDFIFYV